MPLRKPLFATGAVLLSMFLALLLAEVGLRVYFGSREPADFAAVLRRARNAPRTGALALGQIVQASAWPDIVYELRPGLDGTFRGQTLRTNALGIRGAREYAREKPAGTFRIVGLGDSNMFGWGVGEGEPYLQILEKRLGPRFEVLNFGVPGYNGVMEVSTYEHRAAELAPDLVIVHFIGNDFGLPHFLQAPEEARSLLHSYLWELLQARFGSKEDEVDPGLLPHDRSQLDPELRRQARGRYAHMMGKDAYLKAMNRLGELTRARGIPVIILSLGGSGEQGNLARQAAAANGFTFLDASPRFYRYLVEQRMRDDREVWRSTFRIPHDGHPNRLAHELYAEVLEGTIRSLAERRTW
ncbi:MAG TPA: SGNH/GDSL hydrolase family protein [Thermoanaerobaculia bacterium]|nr:SGNH/GDSL hydrolase family protein [Thermoanaerobaculia bacterium]